MHATILTAISSVLSHDAKYHDDAPPLGHEDTWFNEIGSPAPGITDGTQRGEFDDDDDIVVDKATISTRCPLTFQQFKEPYTSIKCPHTFEKNAIIDMIRTSGQRVGGNGQRGSGTLGAHLPCYWLCTGKTYPFSLVL